MTEQTALSFNHTTDYQREWAESTDRVLLFSVTKREPNPDIEGRTPGDDGVVRNDDGSIVPPFVETVIEHTMPKRPNAGLALEYLKLARRSDPDQAMSWLIEKAVGEQGYDDLVIELANPDVTDPMAVLRDLVGRIQRVALGGLEAPKA